MKKSKMKVNAVWKAFVSLAGCIKCIKDHSGVQQFHLLHVCNDYVYMYINIQIIIGIWQYTN